MTNKPDIGTVIVLFGISRAGKDTVAEMIRDHVFSRVTNQDWPELIAFADPIKRAALELFGVPMHISYGSQEIRESAVYYGKSVRQIHQWLGTEIGREQISQNIWVERTGDHIHDTFRSNIPIVVKDGRFFNERSHLAPYLERRGSPRAVRNVLVYRPGLEPNLAHESERQPWQMTQNTMAWLAKGKSLEQDESDGRFHEVIVNDGSFVELRSKVDDLCRRLIR